LCQGVGKMWPNHKYKHLHMFFIHLQEKSVTCDAYGAHTLQADAD